ncbi:Exopolyphosphatase [Entomortierella chlamydospora]|nr:Exopolyphosphatase [Entomortierella chlamydospora]
MDTFLESIHSRLEREPSANVILVTGNESADLDSITSAITTSFFLSRLPSHKASIIVPYINIPRIDLALRSDVEYVLSTNNINRDHLFFRDQLPIFEELVKKNQLSLFLVDHNNVALSLASLKTAKVVGVIDHHADENLYKDTANPRRIEVVGSCASLVADEFLKKVIDSDKTDLSWTQTLARLLLAPILTDTMDLDPEKKKVQPLDIAMTELILSYTGWESIQLYQNIDEAPRDTSNLSRYELLRKQLYQNIDEARRDTSNLSFYDLLRKDYKEWTVIQHSTGKEIKVGISSVVGLMAKYIERDSKEVLQQAIDKWAQNQNLDLSFVMLSGEHEGFHRQLIVNPVSSSVKDVPSQLEKVSLLELKKTPIVDTDEFVKKGGRAYLQHNNACSRKQVWPIIEKLLTQPSQSSNL